MKEVEENRKKREEQNQKFKEFLRVYKSSKPLHELMEEQYVNKVELPMLEENRRKLEEYRELSKVKPSLEEINEHERAYM